MEFPPNYNLCHSYTKPQSWLLCRCVFLLCSSLLRGSPVMATDLKFPAAVAVSKGSGSGKGVTTSVVFSFLTTDRAQIAKTFKSERSRPSFNHSASSWLAVL